MIQVYLPSNTDFDHNGDMTLFPSSATVHAILNGSWTAQLTHPIDTEGRWKYIQEDGVVSMPSFYENSTTLPQQQLFRIKAVSKSDTGITADLEPVFYDAMNDCFLVDVRPTNKTGQEALDILCSNNTKYSGKSNIGRQSTAYYQYKNLLEALNGDDDNSFISRWGGEMLFNDFQVIVNDRVGIDTGYEIRYGKNMPANGLVEDIDTREVVTRIYPKAYNGREMTNHGYVDSELINSYPIIKAATITFDNIKLAEDAGNGGQENGVIICNTQADLDNALQEACEAQYASGIDKPKVSISANMVILKYTDRYKDFQQLEDISLGDSVRCVNTHLEIETDARIIELQYDSLRKKVSSVVIGDYEYNYFNNVTSSADKIEQVVLPSGSLDATRLEGIINGALSQLKIQNTIAEKQDVRAILFEDTDPESSLYGAISIGTQGIQIANERTADGRDWDWRTAINADGAIADVIVAGELNTALLNISDVITAINDNGDTSINSGKVTVDGASLTAVFESITQDANNAANAAADAQETAERAMSELQIFAQGISSTVVNEMLASDEWGELQQSITNVTQTADSVTVTVSSINQSVDQLVSDFYTYFVLAQEGLYIRKEGSEFETLLANDRLSFLQGGNEIAYISANKLYITSAWIKNDLSIENDITGNSVRHYVDQQGFYNIKIMDEG